MIGATVSGRWRPTKEMARQDAIRAGLGFRDPVTGLATIDPQVRIELADGEANSTDADLLDGDAVAVLVVHGQNAESFARAQQALSIDPGERQRWHSILGKIEALRREIRAKAEAATK